MGRLLSTWFWIVVFSLSIIWMLYLGINPQEITQWWLSLLIYNLGFSLLAILLIVRNVRHLIQQESSGVLGSKLTISFIKMVPLIAILPLVSFYFFSFNSIQGTLVDIELFAQDLQKERQEKLNVLASDLGALKLTGYQERTQSLLDDIIQNNRYDTKDAQYQPTMQTIAQYMIDLSLMCDIKIYNGRNEVLAWAKDKKLCPKTLKESSDFFHLSLYASEQFPNQRFVKSNALYSHKDITTLRITVIYSLDKKTNAFLKKLNQSRNSQLNIELNLAPLRNSFLVDMSSTLLLTILSILMIIFKMINTLMTPLNRLSDATKQVAKGDYNVFIAQDSGGDAGILIDLFNHMAKQVKGAQHDLDTERVYLETILKYSYGVIALDEHYRIRLLNPEVNKILKTNNIEQFYKKDYLMIAQAYRELTPLINMIKIHFDANKPEWNEDIEIILNNHSVLLLCQGARLELDDGQILGYVIILKDITKLRQAQDKAAWAAVAMKMAHEIKNPLTPIQLSAERLRHKLLPKLDQEDTKILDKTTKIITKQVKSINTLVSAFAKYTNIPVLEKKPQYLSHIVQQTFQLYEGQKKITITINTNDNEPILLLDENSIQRVLINLIKNAIEAIGNKQLTISVSLQYLIDTAMVCLIIDDNGPGLSENIKNTVFEPYVSTKGKGGGLGMAIVQNILKEHEADISIINRLKNDQIIGARVVINFKVKTT